MINIFKYLIRFTGFFIPIFGSWVLLSGKFDIFHTTIGLLGASAVTLLATLRTDKRAIPFIKIISYMPWLIWQILVANFKVCGIILSPKLQINPQILRRNPHIECNRALTLLAVSITLTPGTFTVDIDNERIIVHALNDDFAKDIDKEILSIKARNVFGK